MTYRLVGADGCPYESAQPGTLGGHRGTRIYGRLDCASALRALARISSRASTLRPFDRGSPELVEGLRAGQAQGNSARGGYQANRVFFADEATALAAGYRPCAVCLPRQYREWRRR